MNTLELIGIREAKGYLVKALEYLSEEEEGRQEHVRPHTEGRVKRAMDVLRALEDNSNEQD